MMLVPVCSCCNKLAASTLSRWVAVDGLSGGHTVQYLCPTTSAAIEPKWLEVETQMPKSEK